MKKSTIIIILIVYLASIIVVGFFGMRVKVYDKVKYVKSIEVTAQAENKDMFVWTEKGLDRNSNHTYELKAFFSDYALEDAEGKKYLAFIFMPQVTYDSGDLAGETEKIQYKVISEIDITENKKVVLSQRGELKINANDIPDFTIEISPVGSSLQGAKAYIKVVLF